MTAISRSRSNGADKMVCHSRAGLVVRGMLCGSGMSALPSCEQGGSENGLSATDAHGDALPVMAPTLRLNGNLRLSKSTTRAVQNQPIAMAVRNSA